MACHHVITDVIALTTPAVMRGRAPGRYRGNNGTNRGGCHGESKQGKLGVSGIRIPSVAHFVTSCIACDRHIDG